MRGRDKDQFDEWHDLFREREYDVSRVKSQYFFHSLCVCELGGILIKLRADQPPLRWTRTRYQ